MPLQLAEPAPGRQCMFGMLHEGVALARWSLIQDELRAGRLVVTFAKLPTLEVFHGYFWVGLRETFRRPEIAAFRAWLLEELRGLVVPA